MFGDSTIEKMEVVAEDTRRINITIIIDTEVKNGGNKGSKKSLKGQYWITMAPMELGIDPSFRYECWIE